MSIGMEARWISSNKTGFGNYAYNLIKEIGKIDKRNEYIVYLNHYYNDSIFTGNIKRRIIRQIPEIYKHIYLPIDVALNTKVDFFHFLYNAPSLIFPRPYLLTIHDMSFKYIPQMLKLKDRLSITYQLAINAHRAKRIIAVSENTKKDIIKFLNIPDKKITVIYEGVDKSYRRISDASRKNEIAKKYGLPERFILYVGTYLPHKNINTLIEAYSILVSDKTVAHSLVLAGNKGRSFKKTSNMISKFKLERHVRCIGFVDEDDLPYVYNMSDLFVFPSMYEGFGLPLIESMACGVPVIATKTSCLPEIGGEAVTYFSPKDRDELYNKMKNILAKAHVRSEMIRRGLRQAKKYSWEKMAKKTIELYKQIEYLLRNC